ncbi:MAG: hypothetical protein ACI93R_003787 [Flavobacteriales bacterium]|jgi:hypothetical protein
MSNHYHIALKIDPEPSKDWRVDEVIQRWRCIHKGPFLIHKYLKDEVTGKAEMAVVIKLVEDWRIRLSNISEFMQRLNQVIWSGCPS